MGKKKLKICCVLDKAEMEADYVQVIEGLAKKGHDVHTYLHTPDTTWNPGIKSLKISCIGDFPLLSRISIINLLTVKIIKGIKRYKLEVVYATGNRLGEALVAGLLTKRPVLCDVRNPWTVQDRDMHGERVPFRTVLGRDIKKLRYLCEEKLIHKAERITAYSPGIKSWLINHLNISRDKIVVIPPHVDTEIFHPQLNGRKIRKKYELGDDSLIIMYVGVIYYPRGIDVLIKAFSLVKGKIANAKLIVVGPLRPSAGPYIKDLQELINLMGLKDSVIFTDYIPFKDVPNYIAAAKVLVIPHRFNFSFSINPPVKLLEYMACQKPVVTTDVGIKDFVINRENAMIVEPEDHTALAEAITYLLDNPTFANYIAKNARQYVVMNHDEKQMVEKFEEQLTKLVRKSP